MFVYTVTFLYNTDAHGKLEKKKRQTGCLYTAQLV